MQDFVHWADRDPIGKDDLILTGMMPEKQAIFRSYLETHSFPPLLLHGPPGSGKSTAARLLSEFEGADVRFENGATLNPKLPWERISMSGTGFFAGKKIIIIVDEADFMSPKLQARSRSVVERSRVVYIFTCNNLEKIDPALQSRFVAFRFGHAPPSQRAQHESDIVKLCQHKMIAAGVTGVPDAEVRRIVASTYADIRRAIGECQRLYASRAVAPASPASAELMQPKYAQRFVSTAKIAAEDLGGPGPMRRKTDSARPAPDGND